MVALTSSAPSRRAEMAWSDARAGRRPPPRQRPPDRLPRPGAFPDAFNPRAAARRAKREEPLDESAARRELGRGADPRCADNVVNTAFCLRRARGGEGATPESARSGLRADPRCADHVVAPPRCPRDGSTGGEARGARRRPVSRGAGRCRMAEARPQEIQPTGDVIVEGLLSVFAGQLYLGELELLVSPGGPLVPAGKPRRWRRLWGAGAFPPRRRIRGVTPRGPVV